MRIEVPFPLTNCRHKRSIVRAWSLCVEKQNGRITVIFSRLTPNPQKGNKKKCNGLLLKPGIPSNIWTALRTWKTSCPHYVPWYQGYPSAVGELYHRHKAHTLQGTRVMRRERDPPALREKTTKGRNPLSHAWHCVLGHWPDNNGSNAWMSSWESWEVHVKNQINCRGGGFAYICIEEVGSLPLALAPGIKSTVPYLLRLISQRFWIKTWNLYPYVPKSPTDKPFLSQVNNKTAMLHKGTEISFSV